MDDICFIKVKKICDTIIDNILASNENDTIFIYNWTLFDARRIINELTFMKINQLKKRKYYFI